MTGRPPAGLRLVRRSPTTWWPVPTLGTPESRGFPQAALDAHRPSPWRYVLGGLLGGALAGVVALLLAPPGWAAWDGAARVAGAVAGLVLLAVVHTRGHPVAYALGGVGGAAAGLALGGRVAPAVVLAVVGCALAVPAWSGYAARTRWWPRLDALAERHRCVEGAVAEAVPVAGSGWPARYDVRVTSPDAPGLHWWALERQASPGSRPLVGDPVRIWYRPDDPEAAVLCVPEDVVAPEARRRRYREHRDANGGVDPTLPLPVRDPPVVVATLPDADAPFPAAAVTALRPGPGRAPVVLAAAAAVLALVSALTFLAGRSGATAAGTAVLVAVAAWVAARTRASRRRRWARLAPLLDRPVRADGVVERVVVAEGSPWCVLHVASPAAPGGTWLARERTTPRLRPTAGQRVTAWHAPDDPGAVVLGIPAAAPDPGREPSGAARAG
ncbi:hypothetical protein [Cellulomonas pakistanensis]|uniref:DUF3592 domain-containing protein n=1 Tax=Cellulomonas pakistanensis TaxID=992287 RepID=A0A919P804_9CELL|nr:hypothetical protein [Cellulomonas pakistanensis]GIG35766.1 hypothetical protein Cpa01nite_11470 [Cellulomonas pakistanensis]